METKKLSVSELRHKLENLTRKEAEEKANKKAISKEYSDIIKEIQQEIAGVLVDLDEAQLGDNSDI